MWVHNEEKEGRRKWKGTGENIFFGFAQTQALFHSERKIAFHIKILNQVGRRVR